MTSIHREYVALHVICVRGKLDENLTSLLNFYKCSVDPCNLVGIWMLHRFIPKVVINFDATTLMRLSPSTITLQLLFPIFVQV